MPIPNEVALIIFSHICPDDLVRLQLVSKSLFQFIQYHEEYLCRAVAEILDPREHLLAHTGQRLSPLKTLQIQWNRDKKIKQLLEKASLGESGNREGFYLLSTYHDVLAWDVQNPETVRGPDFIKSASIEDISHLFEAAKTCANELEIRSKPELEEDSHLLWGDQLRALRGLDSTQTAFMEMVMLRGVAFVLKILVHHSAEAMEELTGWYKPTAHVSKLLAERSRKEGIRDRDE